MRLAIGLWRGWAIAGLMVIVGALAGLTFASAQRSSPAPEASAADPRLAAKARDVLDTYCASCHQSDRASPTTPASNLRNILDLEALAKEPGLVLPGNPDGSRLVQMMMWRHLDSNPPEVSAPTEPKPDDIAAVRAWVKALPAVRPCEVARRLDPDAIADLAAKAVTKIGAEHAKDMRFVSLAAPYNDCATPQQLAAFRADVARALNSLSWGTTLVEPEAIDSSGAVLAFRLVDLGWSAAHWTALSAVSPYANSWRSSARLTSLGTAVGSKDPVVHGGWLVGALTSGPLFDTLLQLPPRDASFAERLGFDLSAARARRLARHGERTDPPPDLVVRYSRPLDLARLAAEYSARPDAVVALSSALSPELALLARRAQQGTVSREDVEDAFRLLGRMPGNATDEPLSPIVRGTIAPTASSDATRPPQIVLLADKPVLPQGEAVSYTVTTDRDCHLTVINVDANGIGTVLFPNELEPDGQIRAGTIVALPSPDAGYELRARKLGTEALVALCNPVSAWAAGIAPDFERQRFTILGDYETFVRKSLLPAPAVPPRETRRRPRRRGKAAPPPPVRPLLGQIGRTGILVEVR
jgi:mono/diheme cytochrome c family protein